jgi:hypothetical protein
MCVTRVCPRAPEWVVGTCACRLGCGTCRTCGCVSGGRAEGGEGGVPSRRRAESSAKYLARPAHCAQRCPLPVASPSFVSVARFPYTPSRVACARHRRKRCIERRHIAQSMPRVARWLFPWVAAAPGSPCIARTPRPSPPADAHGSLNQWPGPSVHPWDPCCRLRTTPQRPCEHSRRATPPTRSPAGASWHACCAARQAVRLHAMWRVMPCCGRPGWPSHIAISSHQLASSGKT